MLTSQEGGCWYAQATKFHVEFSAVSDERPLARFIGTRKLFFVLNFKNWRGSARKLYKNEGGKIENAHEF